MQALTSAGQNVVNDIGRRYNLSQDAVVTMLVAVNNGAGSMAQFYCPELGGGGQWMRGGMTMVGDMFNHGLKNTVDNLCNELSNALANTLMFPPARQGLGGNNWWPGDLGSPISSGGQNNTRYALFPGRLAVESQGQVSVYDTLDHNIGGVSQQQGGDTSLTFSSQYGTVSVSSLPLISGQPIPPAPQTNFANPPQQATPQQQPEPQRPNQGYQGSGASNSAPINSAAGNEVLGLIEKLASLRDAGALTADEFDSKKADLLGRL